MRVCFARKINENWVIGIVEVNKMKEIIYFINYRTEEVCVGREISCISRKEMYVPNEFGGRQGAEARKRGDKFAAVGTGRGRFVGRRGNNLLEELYAERTARSGRRSGGFRNKRVRGREVEIFLVLPLFSFLFP